MGAKGPTLYQLLSFLRSGSSSSDLIKLSSQIVELVLMDGSDLGGPHLAFANGVWFDQSMSLKEDFKKTVTGAFKAETRSLDFQKKVTFHLLWTSLENIIKLAKYSVSIRHLNMCTRSNFSVLTATKTRVKYSGLYFQSKLGC
ncbi:serine protease inhibitor (SERPIN) family protein [Carex rostrata]